MDTKHSMILISAMIILAITISQAAQAEVIAIKTSLVNQDPDPAIAGELFEVRVGVENIGGVPAENVYLELKPEYPFVALQGENYTRRLGTIDAFQGKYDVNQKIAKFRLLVDTGAPEGTYSLRASHGIKGSGATTATDLPIAVKNKQSAEIIQIDKTTLVPGVQTPLKFTITNVGNAPLRDMTFNWNNDDKAILPVGSDNTKYIKYLDIESSAMLEYQVIADGNAVPGLYQLNLNLAFDDSANVNNKTTTQTKQITTYAGVYVGGATDFDIAFSESANGQTSFSVANIGANPATSVSVIIPEQRGWRVTGTNSVIIGNLNKGDYTVASFKLQSPAAAAMNATGMQRSGRGNFTQGAARPGATQQTDSTDGGQQGAWQDRQRAGGNESSMPESVMVEIDYTDTMGQRQKVQKTVKIGAHNLMSAEGGFSAMGARRTTTTPSTAQTIYNYLLENKLYTGIAILFILAWIARGKIRKKKIQDPSFKIKDLFSNKKRK